MRRTQKEIETLLSLAEKFSKILLDWNGKINMLEIVKRNAQETDPNICHSHDFCDSNMAFEEAFIDIFGREPELDKFPDESDNDRWGEAWNLAKEKEFFINA